ncbi:MAG: tRNA (adenosine(37)-N6)-threonylcarbamoyltransferase complex transferase subunit TsaD [Flavobacteriales bacterium]|nr:tRNA (adenosine(37)-N6)-threonylcarbamoyltransferase complex transferase subunit TsaD [Flavobacteriales bacterium]
MKDIVLLAIESSCDDTSAAISINDKILANVVAVQQVHEEYGGVVPELASRAHMQHIVPTVDAALKKAGITKDRLDGIAFTAGPGLLGSLMVGVSFAKSMAQGLQIPMVAVNHMEAHVLAHLINDGSPIPPVPFLCLTVSGGHTQLVEVGKDYTLKVIGETKDDAAGEAFDKAARMLDLPYPGGPLVDKYGREGNPHAFTFAQPQMPGYDFSFSGLKTSILYFLQNELKKDPDFRQKHMADLCASIQHTITDILLKKFEKATVGLGLEHVAIAGGVSANSYLREQFKRMAEQLGWQAYIPAFQYCTDNAGMIAIAGYLKYLRGEWADEHTVPSARLKF